MWSQTKLAPFPTYSVDISQLIRFARVFYNVDDFNLFSTAKLLKQDYRYN